MVTLLSWIKRHWLKAAALLIIVGVSTLFANNWVCPVCHLGILVLPEKVAARAATEPSKNLGIWNGSYHGPNYENYSKICTRCWMAYYPSLGFWDRASEAPDAFLRPLSTAIRRVPLPPAEHIHFRVVYTQTFRDHQFGECVAFWCDDIPTVLQPLREYATAHSLSCRVDEPPRKEGQKFVRIETNPPTYFR